MFGKGSLKMYHVKFKVSDEDFRIINQVDPD